ncbi:hypothetical protein BKA70DRAFT_1127252, partial [Coprinopsis sp. MPI-PUGE-AT-0042]
GPLNVAARDVNNVNNYYYRVESSNDASIPPILESVPNFRGIQIATLGRATPGTGLWIVEHQHIHKKWQKTTVAAYVDFSVVLAEFTYVSNRSIVINALEVHARKGTSPVCVCYIYFRYSDHTKATTRSFLEVLVKQTLERHPGCLPLFYKVYDRHIREKTQPSEEELLDLLRQFTSTVVTFYLLDALDEAPTEIQLEIIERLTSLNAKLFITSRPLKAVEAAFPGIHSFPIAAQSSGLDLHIDKEISRSADLRQILEAGGLSLRNDIASSVKEKCGGMFLHASLQLNALRECTNVCEVKETLAIFPTDIEDLYLQTWKRIASQTQSKVLLAKRLLLWVITATRSWTVDELRHALATRPDTHRFDSSRLIQEGTLIALCRGLVMVEEKTRIVRLVHYTAKGTLERLVTKTFPHPHAFLAAFCLSRLTDGGFQRTALEDRKGFDQAMEDEPFLKYVHNSWSTHVRGSLAKRLAEFVPSCHAFPVLYQRWDDSGHRVTDAFDVLGPLHLIAFFNFPASFAGSDSLQDPNRVTAKLGETALHLVCLQGHDDVTAELVDLPNIMVNAMNIQHVTPLILASGHGGIRRGKHWQLSSVRVNEAGRQAPVRASSTGHKRVLAILLSHPDIDVNMVDASRSTALMKASALGRQDVVEALLSCVDIDVNVRDWFNQTALSTAVSYEGIVKLLLSHSRVDVNVVDNFRRTALSRAVESGEQDVIKLLLAHPSIRVRNRDLEVASQQNPGTASSFHLLDEFLSRS